MRLLFFIIVSLVRQRQRQRDWAMHERRTHTHFVEGDERLRMQASRRQINIFGSLTKGRARQEEAQIILQVQNTFISYDFFVLWVCGIREMSVKVAPAAIEQPVASRSQ